MIRSHYDFIFAGGGIAGLSLACRLAGSRFRDCAILIIDPQAKTQNDRTLCFWADQATPFEAIVYRTWDNLRVATDGFSAQIPLNDYRYRMIRGLDFYGYAHQLLVASGRVDFWRGAVDQIEDGANGAVVHVGGQSISGGWVFDSRPVKIPAAHALRQYFKGWVVETPDAAFDPATATFMDFRAPQENGLAFFYVLPFSSRRALVEYVSLRPGNFAPALRRYLQTTLGISAYRVTAEEGGVNPLTTVTLPRQTGARVMTIGAAGGQLKATTGYAFTRIQADSAAIVQSLEANGHPFAVPAGSAFYRLCDTLMLQVMAHRSERLASVFAAMFSRNPVERVFRFLDEAASPAENLAMMASVPSGPFLAALFRLKVLGQSPDFSTAAGYKL